MTPNTLGIVGCDFCYFVNYDASDDVALYELGDCACEPGYSYGPIIRPRMIFHYVFSGKGKLLLNGKEFEIHAKQGFLIPEGQLAYYEADPEDPWAYCWVHFDGPKATELFNKAGITAQNPVFSPTGETEIIESIIMDLKTHYKQEYYCIGKLYEAADYILSHSSSIPNSHMNLQLNYVKTIINYIHLKYPEDISVSLIAESCGLNRSYMTRLFKDATGSSVQDYLIRYRMKRAAELLTETDTSVQYIGYAVGYKDIFNFSKAFKKHFGSSPKEYRISH